MSIMQDYQSIKSRMKPGEAEAIERYLELHTNILLSDLYYNEERYRQFYKWWQDGPTSNGANVESNISELKSIKVYDTQVYVDGSYNKDKNLTGAGVVVVLNDEVLKKSFRVETEEGHSWNVNGECHAALESLRICSGISTIQGKTVLSKNVTINYDYEGIEKWITKEWKAKSKIARQYFSSFNDLVEKYDIKVTFNKVKAHSGDIYNEVADKLAKEAALI